MKKIIFIALFLFMATPSKGNDETPKSPEIAVVEAKKRRPFVDNIRSFFSSAIRLVLSRTRRVTSQESQLNQAEEERNRQDSGSEKLSLYRIEKKAEHFPFDFEKWYGKLASFSFYSELVSITPEVARSMVNYYQERFIGRARLNEEDVKNLLGLRNEIRERMDQMLTDGHSREVFVRMSNRSPKDGTPLLTGRESSLSRCLKILNDPEFSTPNDKIAAICDLQMEFLKCTDADQVLNLLLTSERVYTDLSLALDCHQLDSNDEWSTNVILREWEPGLRQDSEFRVFVHDGRVTAVSQYNPYCRYDSLTKIANSQAEIELKEAINNFVKNVVARIGMRDFIIDLALIGRTIKVIELNPFQTSTGGCMFSWRDDGEILAGNNPDIAFRVREKDGEQLDQLVNTIVRNEEELAKEGLIPYFSLLEKILPGSMNENPDSTSGNDKGKEEDVAEDSQSHLRTGLIRDVIREQPGLEIPDVYRQVDEIMGTTYDDVNYDLAESNDLTEIDLGLNPSRGFFGMFGGK